MQKIAHIIALIIAYIIWHSIGGFLGFIVAVLGFAIIEIMVLVIIGAISAPFQGKNQSPEIQAPKKYPERTEVPSNKKDS